MSMEEQEQHDFILENGVQFITGETVGGTLEDLPKVSLREDEEGNMHLRNLSNRVLWTLELNQ